MRVRYSFSCRRTGIIDSNNQHRIEFPEIAKQVMIQSDIILEILDSRFWQETRNLEIEKKILDGGKKLIFVLNKSDLVDSGKLTKELREKRIYPFILVSCKDRKGARELRAKIKIEASKMEKGRIEVGIIGYPNTGKSSIINILVGKKSTRVAPESGFTKGIQKLKLSDNIYLIDTPGVIPSYENSNLSSKDLVKHAQINVRTWDKIKDPEGVLYSLIKQYPGIFEKFYNINAEGNPEVLIEEFGRKKHILKRGNLVDTDRVARMVLRDFQDGKIRV
ncbi:MAG: 50S ribosome-binding GTPase [Nanoarchaeota archaeon]|nr:50S ribosome-binding GTPase [Nanoarchaeota archaeon]